MLKCSLLNTLEWPTQVKFLLIARCFSLSLSALWVAPCLPHNRSTPAPKLDHLASTPDQMETSVTGIEQSL